MTEPQKPTGQSILEGTLAQMLGGAVATMIVTMLASFHIYLAAGFEAAFGTTLSIAFYLCVKRLRAR